MVISEYVAQKVEKRIRQDGFEREFFGRGRPARDGVDGGVKIDVVQVPVRRGRSDADAAEQAVSRGSENGGRVHVGTDLVAQQSDRDVVEAIVHRMPPMCQDAKGAVLERLLF